MRHELPCDELYLTLSDNNVEKHDFEGNSSSVVSLTAMSLNYSIIYLLMSYILNLCKKRRVSATEKVCRPPRHRTERSLHGW